MITGMRKSTSFKFLMLLVFSCGTLALEPIDRSTSHSKLELDKAKEHHERFFDIDRSGTLTFSLENNIISSQNCFHNMENNTKNCTTFLYEIGENYTRKKCEIITNYFENTADNYTKIKSVDPSTIISFIFSRHIGHNPEERLFVSLITNLEEGSLDCASFYSTIDVPKTKWANKEYPTVLTYGNHVDLFYSYSDTQAVIHESTYDEKVNNTEFKEIYYKQGLINISNMDQLKPLAWSDYKKVGYINFSRKQMSVTTYVKKNTFSVEMIDQLDLKNAGLQDAEDMQVVVTEFNSLVSLTSIIKKKSLLVVVDKDLIFKKPITVDLVANVKQVRIYYSDLRKSFYLLQSECQNNNRNCRVFSQKLDNDASPIGKNEFIANLDTADCDLVDFNVIKPNDYLAHICKKHLIYGSNKSINYFILKATDPTRIVPNTISENLSYLGPSEIWEYHFNEYKRLMDIEKKIAYKQNAKM